MKHRLTRLFLVAALLAGVIVLVDRAPVIAQNILRLAGTGSSGEPVMIGVSGNALNTNITANVPGTTATSLGKAEDAASASADTGVAVLVRRCDAVIQVSGFIAP